MGQAFQNKTYANCFWTRRDYIYNANGWKNSEIYNIKKYVNM